MHAFLLAVLRNQRGATAVEYALILALICLGVFGAMSGAAKEVVSLWTYVAERVAAATH